MDKGSDSWGDLKKRQHGGAPGASGGMGPDGEHDTSSRPQDKLATQPNLKTRLKNKKMSAAYQDMRRRSQSGSGRDNMGGVGIRAGTEYTQPTINESTNWKGGSKHIGLARYSAKQGYGVQITQIQAMPGDKMNWAKGAGFVKMPVKDIPKLCKALMNVYKAPANVQLGDDD